MRVLPSPDYFIQSYKSCSGLASRPNAPVGWRAVSAVVQRTLMFVQYYPKKIFDCRYSALGRQDRLLQLENPLTQEFVPDQGFPFLGH